MISKLHDVKVTDHTQKVEKGLKCAPDSILIANMRLIGDVILTTPLIGILKAAYPDAAIDLLVNKGTGEFLEKDPRIRKVIYSQKNRAHNLSEVKAPGYYREILLGYDLAINMNSADRGSIAILLAGKSHRVGFYQETGFLKNFWKKLLFTHPIYFPSSVHVARICQLVADKLNLSVSQLEVRIFWDESDDARVRSFLASKLVPGPFFVIHPFARWCYKYWKAEHFAHVSDALVERYGLQPIWTSSPDHEEMELLRNSVRLCKHPPATVLGEFTLNQMMCLMSRATFYLGLDTAISHLAAAAGIPMVVLYGPTIAERWSPWNNNGPVAQQCPLSRGSQRNGRIILLQKEWSCIPCGFAGCDDNWQESPCLQDIDPSEVLAAVDGLLKPLTPGLANG
jgi:heptosyltransferase-3